MHNAATSFVALDREMLGTFSEVTDCCLDSRRPAPASLWARVRNCDLVFGWFASGHTLLPLLFAWLLGKPSVLVIGGYDIANIPEIAYGHQRGGLAKWVSRATIMLATQLVTNSHYSRDEARANLDISGERITVIHHGIPDRLDTFGSTQRERLALTVGHVSRSNLTRKGLECFVRAGALLPDVSFVVAGRRADEGFEYLRSIATSNVTLTGQVSDMELNDWYRRASVYVQASRHEGFGMSLAEAMLAGCMPVVTREGAIPEVTGDNAVFLESQDPAELAAAIRTALAATDDARSLVRKRIATCFPLVRRRDALENIVRATISEAEKALA